MVYRLQLDSVWVGLLYRIGTDIQELQECLLNQEHFELFKVSLIGKYYGLLERRLSEGKELKAETLRECK